MSATIPNLDYDQYRAEARDADIALWAPRDQIGRIIAAETGGPYCHVSGIAFDCYGRLWQYGYHAITHGGYGSPLSKEVRQNSGCITVFRLKPEFKFEPEHVVEHLVGDLGGDYAMGDIRINVDAWLFDKFPFLKRVFRGTYEKRVEVSDRKKSTADCSHHIARAYKLGTHISLCDKPLSIISPNDIARSTALRPVGTLVWPAHFGRRRVA